MNDWIKLARKRLRALDMDTGGATMVEYVVILCLIFLVAFKAWDSLGGKVRDRTQGVADKLNPPP